MAALTGPRMKREKSLKQIEAVLADGEVAHLDGLACIDTASGEAVAGQTGEGLIPVGYFILVPHAGLTGDGTLTVKIRLFAEVIAHWWDNDTGTPVTAADLLGLCYILDDHTVTGDATGASVAGRVWGVDEKRGVLVQMATNIGPTGPQGEAGGG